MDLVGTITTLGVVYPLVYTQFNKTSQMWILLNQNVNYISILQGTRINEEDIIEMLDKGQQKKIGNPIRLDRVLQELDAFKSQCVRSGVPTLVGSTSQYTDTKGNVLHLHGREYVYVRFKSKNGTAIVLEQGHNLKIDKTAVRARSENVELDQTKTHLSQFLDSTMESLILRGFNFDWLEHKKYTPIHSIKEFKEIFLPHLKRELNKHKLAGKKLLLTLDFEATGVNAYGENCPYRDTTTFLGMSFEDHTAYGVFLAMEHFDNIESDEIAKEMTALFSHDLCFDRDIDILGTAYKRSDIITSAHNLMIDRRFGLVASMDIWINLCSMQIGFNLDPFLTKGHNGAKDRAEQFFGIRYPELGDTAGKGFYGYFNRFSDKRVIMMYGCADVDLVRMYTQQMLDEIPKLKSYFGVDQIQKYHKLDETWLNLKALFDYKGIRIDKELLKKKAAISASKIKTLTDFLAAYIPKAKVTVEYLTRLRQAEENGKDLSTIKEPPPDLNAIPPQPRDKWSGDFLIDTLFIDLNYDLLYLTKVDDKDKDKKQKARLDKDAVNDYLLHEAKIVYPEKITSLADFEIQGKYLARDVFYDLLDNKGNPIVAISAEKFNSYQYPLFHVLSMLGPLEKEMSSDFAPLLLHETDYRFADTRTTTIVTRRDVSPLSTVKGANKDLYIAYDPKEFYVLDADQAAVEIRVAAGLSGDQALIKPLCNPENDPHIETAAKMLKKLAYLIDKKKERGPIKFINFGRIYKRGAYSICKQIHGVVTTALKANVELLLALFDKEKASIHIALDIYRANSTVPKEVPAWLRWFLKMPEDIVYGRMDNLTGFSQHLSLSRTESWWIPSMQRKAGNFCVQGLAANILRELYGRFAVGCWEKGWIQDGRVIIHNTVYDEILMSFHKSIDPFELIAILRKAFVVKFGIFPPLFLGVNIAYSWGDTKDDKFEIPHNLLKRYQEQFEAGTSPKLDPDTDYVQWFLKAIVEYKIERAKEELIKLGFDKTKILVCEDFNEKFTNYYVRTLIMDFKGELFTIHDNKDPVELFASTNLHFISKYMLEDGDLLKVKLRGKSFGITNKSHTLKFGSESDLINGIRPKPKDLPEVDTHTLISDDDEDDDTFYTFNDFDEESYANSDMALTSWVLPDDYDPTKFKIKDQQEAATYEHFVVRGGCVVIKTTSNEQAFAIKKFLLNKATTSTDSVKLFTRLRSVNTGLGQYKVDVLESLDNKEELWT